jgi:hypothetical protein
MRFNAWLCLALILFLIICSSAFAQNKYYEKAIYTDEYGLSFYPTYPPTIGETITLRLRTFIPAQKVTLYSDREEKISMVYREGHWWAKFTIPKDYQAGPHFFTIWIKYPDNNLISKSSDWISTWLDHLDFGEKKQSASWSKSKVWYKVIKQKIKTEELEETKKSVPLPEIALEEQDNIPPPVAGEAIEIIRVSPEASPLLIKGSKTVTFKTRTLEGSKEGIIPGTSQTREETTRLNISGKASDIDIEATLYRTTTLGISQVGEREEKISILLRRENTEVYLGDFTADLTETEFAGLNRVLSGGRIKGDYGNWGFSALYSSPKGESKFSRRYGDGTQGPYWLPSAPVVIDSERVYVDSLRQNRGQDYNIDYQAGTVTFIKRVIDAKSVIRIFYDFRQTVYQHVTYGLRAFYKPLPNLKFAATFLDDSDNLAGAEKIRESLSQEAFDPQGHYVVGTDGCYVGENLSTNWELAYSEKKLNLLSSASSKEAGVAGKIGVGASLGPVGIRAHYKKVGPQFRLISDPDPKLDVWDFGAELSFRPSAYFVSSANYNYQKYSQSGVLYENSYKHAKAQILPPSFPSLEYSFSEIDESNDPVTGDLIRRLRSKNSIETVYQFGLLSSSARVTLEKWFSRSPSEETTDYKKADLGLATVGTEKFAFSSNLELEERRQPGGLKSLRKTGSLILSALPSKEFFVTSSLQIIDDSLEGQTSVVDLAYLAQPSRIFKAEGKYSIASVKEEFPATFETVSRQTGSFSFELRPGRELRLRYLYKPNFTQVLKTRSLSYSNCQQRAEINLAPARYALLGMIYKKRESFSIDKNDYPDFKLKDRTQDFQSILYTLKLAPLKLLSAELYYLCEDATTKTLIPSGPDTYEKGAQAARKFDAIVKTSLSERFSIDSRYIYQKIYQGTGESSSNFENFQSHSASLKGIWNFSQAFSFSLFSAYSLKNDYILSQEIYTFSPGFGVIYRLRDTLRIDFEYVHSKSFAAEETEKDNYSLKTRYALSEYASLALRVDQEVSRRPNYRLTDIAGNIEINL